MMCRLLLRFSPSTVRCTIRFDESSLLEENVVPRVQVRQLEMERFSLAASADHDKGAADRLVALDASLNNTRARQEVRLFLTVSRTPAYICICCGTVRLGNPVFDKVATGSFVATSCGQGS